MAHIENRWEKLVGCQRIQTDRHGKSHRWPARYLDPDGRERARTFPRKHILPLLGRRPLAAVTRSEVQAWVKSRSQVLAPTTTATVYAVLRMLFRSAVADRLYAVSPCELVSLPKVPPRELVPLAREAVLALADEVPDLTGPSSSPPPGPGSARESYSASHADQLRVDGPLADVVLEALAAHVERYPSATALDERGRPSDLVFSDATSRPVSRTYFHRRAWAPAVKRVGLPTGTRFHELRHFYASLLIDGGESVKAVQTRLGHATAEETLNTYAHL